MRLRERDKRTIECFDPADQGGEDVYLWGGHRPLRAAVYPKGRSLDPKIYGDRVRDMRLMLYDGAFALKAGMGVRVDAQDGPPDYQIRDIEPWAHQRAVLELIPEGRRGDGH